MCNLKKHRLRLSRDGSSHLGLAALGSLDGGLLLGKDDLDVAWVRHVRVDATVSTVGAASVLHGLVDLDVTDLEFVHVQRLQLSIGLSVGKKVEHELSGLLGPASLAVGGASVLGLASAADTTAVTTERNGLGLLHDVLEVGLRLLEHHAPDGVASLTSVLEVNTEMRAAGLAGFRLVFECASVRLHHGWVFEVSWAPMYSAL